MVSNIPCLPLTSTDMSALLICTTKLTSFVSLGVRGMDQSMSHKATCGTHLVLRLESNSCLIVAAGHVLLNGSQQCCTDLQASGGGTPVPLSCHIRRQPHLNDRGQCIAPWLQYQPVKGRA